MFEWLLENGQMSGAVIAFFAAALAFLLAGIGSAKGVGIAGEAACGVVAEDTDKFVPVMILQLLPSTQGIYGFIIAFMIISKDLTNISVASGLQLLAVALPIGLVGLISGIFQGRVAAAGINIVAKRSEDMIKGIILTLMVEIFAIFALLVSILMLNQV